MVTALVCVAVSVTTPWLTFQLVKRREMAEGLRVEVEKLELVKKPGLAQTLRNEIERQREMLRLGWKKSDMSESAGGASLGKSDSWGSRRSAWEARQHPTSPGSFRARSEVQGDC